MGKAQRNREANARQRIALAQAAARQGRGPAENAGRGRQCARRGDHRGRPDRRQDDHQSNTAKVNTTAISNQTVVHQITSVPATVLDKVGAGPSPGGRAAEDDLKPVAVARRQAGDAVYRRRVLPLLRRRALGDGPVALSRFGTFSNLHFIHSTCNDVYSNTSTLTFYKSSYTSKYLTFRPLETFTVDNKPLQKATTAETALLPSTGRAASRSSTSAASTSSAARSTCRACSARPRPRTRPTSG